LSQRKLYYQACCYPQSTKQSSFLTR